MPVAATFAVRDEDGFSLSDVARLDTMVSVVDAANLLRDFSSTDFLRDRGESLGDDDERTLVDLLTEQIEFADVIVINKLDCTDAAMREDVRRVVKALNPTAQLIETAHARVAPAAILATGLFDFDRARTAAGWARELAGLHTPETEEYGIHNFIYRHRRPFHPQRLYDFLNSDWGPVLRSKDYFWLASRMDWAGEWTQAGGAMTHQAAGFWWSATEEPLPDDPETRHYLETI